MPSQFSNPLQWPPANHPSTIYRPKYRQKTTSQQFALDASTLISRPQASGLMDAVQALEEWRSHEEEKKRGKGFRWHPQQSIALGVYIDPHLKTIHYPLIHRALREWEACSGGHIKFIESVRPSEGMIRLEFSDEIVLGRTYEVGHTSRQIQSPHWIVGATITLIRSPEIDKHLLGRQLEQRVYATILHELGHALGLEHSEHPRDVMFHQGWRNTQLTLNDIQHLQSLYQLTQNALTWEG